MCNIIYKYLYDGHEVTVNDWSVRGVVRQRPRSLAWHDALLSNIEQLTTVRLRELLGDSQLLVSLVFQMCLALARIKRKYFL